MKTQSNFLFRHIILKIKMMFILVLFFHSLFGQVGAIFPGIATPFIGGVYYGRTTVINKNDNLKMQFALFDYDIASQKMKMQFGNKSYYNFIPTWQLIPLVKYVESNDPVILSITMSGLQNNNTTRPIHYHPAFANTILGLRFLQADLFFTDIYERIEPRLLSVFAEGELEFSGRHYYDSYSDKHDSYMLTDLHSDIEFKTLDDQFYMTGEPYYLFTQTSYDLNQYSFIIRNYLGSKIDGNDFHQLKEVLTNNTENFSWEWEKIHNTIDFMYTKAYITKVAKHLRKLIGDHDISPNDTDTYAYYINYIYEKVVPIEKATQYDYNFIRAEQFKNYFDWLHKEYPQDGSIKEIYEIDGNVTSALSDSTLYGDNYAKDIKLLKLEPLQELYVISQVALKKEISVITVPSSLKFIDENVFSYNPNVMNACIQSMRWVALFRHIKSENPKEWRKFVTKVSSFDDSSFKINTPKNLKLKPQSSSLYDDY